MPRVAHEQHDKMYDEYYFGEGQCSQHQIFNLFDWKSRGEQLERARLGFRQIAARQEYTNRIGRAAMTFSIRQWFARERVFYPCDIVICDWITYQDRRLDRFIHEQESYKVADISRAQLIAKCRSITHGEISRSILDKLSLYVTDVNNNPTSGIDRAEQFRGMTHLHAATNPIPHLIPNLNIRGDIISWTGPSMLDIEVCHTREDAERAMSRDGDCLVPLTMVEPAPSITDDHLARLIARIPRGIIPRNIHRIVTIGSSESLVHRTINPSAHLIVDEIAEWPE